MIFSVTQNHWQFDTVHIVYAVYDIEPETTDKKRRPLFGLKCT